MTLTLKSKLVLIIGLLTLESQWRQNLNSNVTEWYDPQLQLAVKLSRGPDSARADVWRVMRYALCLLREITTSVMR